MPVTLVDAPRVPAPKRSARPVVPTSQSPSGKTPGGARPAPPVAWLRVITPAASFSPTRPPRSIGSLPEPVTDPVALAAVIVPTLAPTRPPRALVPLTLPVAERAEPPELSGPARRARGGGAALDGPEVLADQPAHDARPRDADRAGRI